MFDLIAFVKAAGYLGLFAVIFTESGLFFGFFLPGDSLLFTAGFLASQGFLNFWFLLAVVFVAAVFGVSAGYAFGKKIGPMIFTKEDSFFFHKDYLETAKVYYEKYGGKTLILARFLPGVRTFASILAGVGRMNYAKFIFYNIIGAFLWAVGLPGLGYYLGSAIPDIDRYLLPIIVFIIFLSILPTAMHILRDSGHRARLWNMLRSIFVK